MSTPILERDGCFAFVFGRVSQDERTVSVHSPKLVDSLPARQIECALSGFRRSIAVTERGELYHWGLVQPSCGIAAKDVTDFERMSGNFHRVHLPDAVPVKMADGNRNALYAVAENGSVYSWSGVLELDGSGGGGSLKKLHGATTGGEFDSLLRQRAAVAAAENLAQRQVASAAAAATDVASVMIASQDASTDDDRDRPAAFSVERPDLLPFRASSLRFITQPPELVSGLVNQRIVRVACGSNYVLACGGDGSLFSWGRGAHGRLGHGGCDDESAPRRVASLSNESVTHIAAGFYHSAAIVASGHVYVWGCGRAGQLGLNDFSDALVPKKLDFPPSPMSPLAADGITRRSSLSVSRAATLLSHQLHASPIPPPATPPDMPTPLDLGEALESSHVSSCDTIATTVLPADIACGYQHTVLLDSLGRVWSWGNNDDGALGFGDTLTRISPTLVRRQRIISKLSQAVAGDIIVSISAGSHHSAAVSQSGRLFTWGANLFGQLGHGHRENEWSPVLVSALGGMCVSHVACSGDHTLAVTSRLIVCKDDHFFSTADASSRSVVKQPATSHALFFTEAAAINSSSAHLSASDLALAEEFAHARVSAAANTTVEHNDDSFSFISYLRRTFASDSPSAVAAAAAHSSPPASPRQQRGLSSAFFSSLFSSSTSATNCDRLVASSTTGRAQVSLIAAASSASFRPSNLPPKDPAEAEKHEDSVKALYAEFRQKLERDARDRASQRQIFQAQRDRAADEKKKSLKRVVEREEKLEQVAKLWTERFIPDFEARKASAELLELTMSFGVPPKLRGEVWQLAIGDQLMITPELYQNACDRSQATRRTLLAARAASAHVAHSEEVDARALTYGQERTFENIAVDLERTFPTLAFFQESGPMHDQLRVLLETYCFYRTDIGYVQGMSFLAGNLLLYMDPYAAFVCFANLLNKSYFFTFLKMNVDEMGERYRIFATLFQETAPRLHAHFEAENISHDMFLLEWCLTLFAKRLSLDVVSRVWDCFLLHGEVVIYRFAVAILTILAPRLHEQPFDVIMDCLKTLPLTITEDTLFAEVATIRVSDELRAKIAALAIRKPQRR